MYRFNVSSRVKLVLSAVAETIAKQIKNLEVDVGVSGDVGNVRFITR